MREADSQPVLPISFPWAPPAPMSHRRMMKTTPWGARSSPPWPRPCSHGVVGAASGPPEAQPAALAGDTPQACHLLCPLTALETLLQHLSPSLLPWGNPSPRSLLPTAASPPLVLSCSGSASPITITSIPDEASQILSAHLRASSPASCSNWDDRKTIIPLLKDSSDEAGKLCAATSQAGPLWNAKALITAFNYNTTKQLSCQWTHSISCGFVKNVFWLLGFDPFSSVLHTAVGFCLFQVCFFLF